MVLWSKYHKMGLFRKKSGFWPKLAKMVEIAPKWGVFDPPLDLGQISKKLFSRFLARQVLRNPDLPVRLLTAKMAVFLENHEKTRFLQIAGNVPRIRHLLERPRRTFLPHEGLRGPLFGGPRQCRRTAFPKMIPKVPFPLFHQE